MAADKRKFHEGKQKKSLMSGASRSNSDDSEFLISLKHLDREQGQTLSHWQEEGILAQALETLRDYCGQSIHAQKGKSFTIYGDFPPRDKTDYKHPKHVPEDAEWARIHVNGKVCVVGHVVRNIFNIVFLDMDHKFWVSELKHT